MGRPKGYEREEVLRRATHLFWERGYAGASLSELVAATGLNRFSLYAEFGGKEGLFEAALESYLASLGGLEALLRAEPAGVERILDFFRASSELDFRLGCFAVNTLREKHVAPPRAVQAVERMARSVEKLLLRNLRAARERGELAPEADPASLAKLLAALDLGLTTYAIVSPARKARARVVAEVERLLR